MIFLRCLFFPSWRIAVNKAKGYYLDRIGAIIGEARNYRKDQDYRLAIRIRIIANNGGGTPDEIIVILRNIYGVAIRYFEYGTVYFQVYIEAKQKPIGINSILSQLKPVGVNIPAVIHCLNNNVFRFAESCKAEDTLSVKNNNSENIANSFLQVHKNELETREIQITFDSFEFPDNTNGFAEILIHRFSIELDDKNQYLVDKTNELETVMSYKDFIIEGGSAFAEVIANE